jgi:ribosomal protein L29
MSKLTKDLLKLSPEALENRITELRVQLVDQKRARAAGELANPHAIKKTRREIAVALTLINGQEENAAKNEKEEA